MEITGLRDIFLSQEEYLDTEVMVSGWVRSNRDSKNFGFLVISDGTFGLPGWIPSKWRSDYKGG